MKKPPVQEKSIAYAKFKKLIEQEIRNHWHQLSCQEYAQRYLVSINPQPATIAQAPGDNKNPFQSINIPPQDFIKNTSAVQWKIRLNSLVGFVTIFEQYLFDTVERAIYVDPRTVDDSSMPFEAKELCAIDGGSLRSWLAGKMAEKYLRNKTHTEMMARIDKFCLCSASKSTDAKEWEKWTLVRNSIVHTAGFATKDLVTAWPSKFKNTGDPLVLTDADLSAAHTLAIKLATTIDKMAIKNVVKKEDAKLLAKELFIQNGIGKPSEVRLQLNKILQSTLTDNQIQKIIADQSKGALPNDWNLTHGEIKLIST